MNALKRIPGASWASHHPRLAAWIVLSLGMVAIIVYEARDVGLQATQWIALIVATVLIAGLCVYIVSWEDSAEPDEAAPAADAVVVTEPEKDAAS